MTKSQMITQILAYNRKFKYFGENNERELREQLEEMSADDLAQYLAEEVDEYGELDIS